MSYTDQSPTRNVEQHPQGTETTSAANSTLAQIRERVRKADVFVGEQFRLYGQLRQARWPHWWRALAEVLVTLIFALLPVWVPIIAFPMYGKADFFDPNVLHDQIKNGELYIIATGLLAPIYYFTFTQYKRSDGSFRPFPSQQILILIFIGTVIVSVISVMASKGPMALPSIPSRMIGISFWLLAFCTFIFLISLTARNSIEELTEQLYDGHSRAENQRNANVPQPPPQDPEQLVNDIIRENQV